MINYNNAMPYQSQQNPIGDYNQQQYGYNSSYNQQQYNYNYTIPKSPIGNVAGMPGSTMGIGNNGYNGGYYSNTYSNYYNPYVASKQQEILRAQQMEYQRRETDIMKKMSKQANRYNGKEMSEEELNKIYDPQSCQQYNQGYTQEMYEAMQTHKLMMHAINQRLNKLPKPVNEQEQIHYTVSSKYKEQFPDDMGVFEYLDNAWKIAQEAKDEELRREQRNLSKLYNRNQYNELLKMHSNTSNYFNSALTNPMGTSHYSNANIDDMEISLPEALKKSNLRKQQFLDSIFKNK